jgi:glycine hydroxymethyltransferase
MKGGLKLVGNRTENHMMLIDLIPALGPGGGILLEKTLDMMGLTLNKNTIPLDPSSPFYPSGVRLGTPAATTRGMKEKEMKFIGQIIVRVLNLIKPYHLPLNKDTRMEYILGFEKKMKENKEIKKMRDEIKKMVIRFPIP